MISSKYLYVVSLLVLAWAGSLASVYYYCTSSPASSQATSQELLYQAIADEIEVITQQNLEATVEELKEDSKAKFLPLLPALDEINTLKEKITRQIDKEIRLLATPKGNNLTPQEKLKQLTKQAQVAVELMGNSSAVLLEKYGQDFDLSSDDIVNTNITFQEILIAFRASSNANRLNTENRNMEEQLLSLKMDLRLRTLQIQSKLRTIHGGRMLICFPPPLLPFLDSHDIVAKRGKKHQLDFGVSDYTSTISPENYQLVVGTDTIPFNDYGFSSVEVPTDKRGKQKIETKLIVTNPLTGLQRVNETYFHYYVE